MLWKKISTGFALTLATLLSVGCTKTKGANAAKASIIQCEGNDLCDAMLKDYDKRLAHQRDAPLGSGFDIAPTVLEYIKPGMSFDQGEQILRAAGLNVGGRPGPEGWKGNRADRFAVSAYSYEFFNRSLSARLLRPIWKDYSRKLFVNLFPEQPGDYNKIAEVTAFVTLSSF